MNSQCDQLPNGLIAQSVEYCTSIAEVMGSNPVQARAKICTLCGVDKIRIRPNQTGSDRTGSRIGSWIGSLKKKF